MQGAVSAVIVALYILISAVLSMIAGYDELAITTLEPGFFFGFTDHDIVVDNITLATNIQVVGCNPTDIAEPIGVPDLADIQCFTEGFLIGDRLR